MDALARIFLGMFYEALFEEEWKIQPQVLQSLAKSCSETATAMLKEQSAELKVYTVAEAATVMNCSQKTIRFFIDKQGLKATAMNPESKKRRYLITHQALMEFMAQT